MAILLTWAVLLIVAAIPVLAASVNWHSAEFAVTNKRVILKIGFIQSKTAEMFLNKIESVGIDPNAYRPRAWLRHHRDPRYRRVLRAVPSSLGTPGVPQTNPGTDRENIRADPSPGTGRLLEQLNGIPNLSTILKLV